MNDMSRFCELISKEELETLAPIVDYLYNTLNREDTNDIKEQKVVDNSSKPVPRKPLPGSTELNEGVDTTRTRKEIFNETEK